MLRPWRNAIWVPSGDQARLERAGRPGDTPRRRRRRTLTTWMMPPSAVHVGDVLAVRRPGRHPGRPGRDLGEPACRPRRSRRAHRSLATKASRVGVWRPREVARRLGQELLRRCRRRSRRSARSRRPDLRRVGDVRPVRRAGADRDAEERTAPNRRSSSRPRRSASARCRSAVRREDDLRAVRRPLRAAVAGRRRVITGLDGSSQCRHCNEPDQGRPPHRVILCTISQSFSTTSCWSA